MTKKQIISLILLAAAFVVLDLGIYFNFTKNFINSSSPEMQAKSVEVSEYLPFDDDSKIVRLDTDMKLTGELPVLDGAAALFPVYSAIAGATYPEDSITYDEAAQTFAENSALQYTNTRGAYKRIVDGDCDMIFVAKPSEEQLKYAEDKGVELEFVPIGREAFVFIVNSSNPVDDITVDELKAIYSGGITNWKELGGEDRLIHATQRNEGSGSQTAFLGIMGDTEVHPSILGPLGSPIGFSFRYYVEGIVENGGVKMLALDGAYPDKENIRNGKYPVVADIFAVYRKGDDGPNVRKLVDWILSDEGQKIIEESGYVALE
ncbi:MAG: substrate-binding domain-containing protein [Firmicutes bacterium]|nr:substrate-binding domain-containing protein [Bacillota bacterium]